MYILNYAQTEQVQGGIISEEAFYGTSFAVLGAVSAYVLHTIADKNSTEILVAMGQTGILTGAMGVVYGAISEEHRV